MSRSGLARADAGQSSLLLLLAFFWAKISQGLFCRQVWCRLNPGALVPRLTPLTFFRLSAAQCLLHAVALPVQLAGLSLTLPFIWVFAFFQNSTVFAFTQEPGTRPLRHLFSQSIRETHVWWQQNHVLFLLLLAFSGFVWLNVVLLAAAIPFFLKSFLGIESEFTRNPLASSMNTTFAAVTFVITWLLTAPLFRICYTLRCFYSVSRDTGADVLSDLHRIRAEKSTSPALVAALLCLLAASPACGQEPAPPAKAPAPIATESAPAIVPLPPGEAGQLRDSIRRTLEKREYQWRLPREKGDGATAGAKPEENMLQRSLKYMGRALSEWTKAFGRLAKKVFDKVFGSGPSSSPSTGSGGSILAGAGAMLQLLLWILGIALLSALIWVITRMVINRRRNPADPGEAAASLLPVDLTSEEILASQLPEDEWLRLAREQMAKGDARLAIRALFLANLAHLGERRLLDIVRSKSNRDYREELLLRARQREELQAVFSENIGIFEPVWYGTHPAGQSLVDLLTANYERLKTHASPA